MPLPISFRLDPAVMQTLYFSPEGGRLGAGCLSGRVRVWDLRRTREQLAAFGLDWEMPGIPPTSKDFAQVQRVVVAR